MKYLLTLLISISALQASTQIYGLGNSTTQKFVSSGDAILRIQPDQVVLNLGIESRGKDLIATKEDNNKKLSASIKYCKANGISDEFIQTDYIRINPHYDYGSKIFADYYNVSQSFSIIIDDLAKYEEFLTDLLGLGINRVNNIEFRTTKFKENRIKVRKMAIEAAKEKAVFLSNEIGIELGKIINISESTRNPVNSFTQSNYANTTRNVVNFNSGDSTLAVGMISLKADATLTFEIKK